MSSSSSYKDVRSSAKGESENQHLSNIESEEKQEEIVKKSPIKSLQVKEENLLVKEKRELKQKKNKKEKELEDGEVSSDESNVEMPVCHFYLTSYCKRGQNCYYKHPGSKAMGNYEMFKRMELPLPIDTPWFNYSNNSIKSFDDNLQELKEKMKKAGYKMDQNNTCIIRKPLLDLNELDKVPYYTNQVEENLVVSNSFRKVTLWPNRPPSSSSSSDYTSTTSSALSSVASSSFIGNLRKRKLKHHKKSIAKRQKRGAYSPYSSSDCSTYGSTTNYSEISSSSSDLYYGSCRKKKYKSSKELDRIFLKRKLNYVERKAKYLEAKINMKKRFLKRED